MSRKGLKGCSGRQNKQMPVPLASVCSVHTEELAPCCPCPLVPQTAGGQASQPQTWPITKQSLLMVLHSTVLRTRSAVRCEGEERDVLLTGRSKHFWSNLPFEKSIRVNSRLSPLSCRSDPLRRNGQLAQRGVAVVVRNRTQTTASTLLPSRSYCHSSSTWRSML